MTGIARNNPAADSAFAEALKKVSPQAQAKAKKTSQDFESVFLNTMFSQMTSSVKGEGPFGDTVGTGAWRSMLTDQYARSFVKAGGIGLSNDVYRSLILKQAATSGATGA
ncbi:flagellar assembly peptidoglycan hydrolase FlgJ [Bradyrhizobium sp. U87765 SZCCT0131]|uniref:flagellar assembly peptidoglycan hydrolase FlgJ n=1 Tax=unclassified Bradyrhizobium TaxID=2631580 RepID=UPI001BAB5AAF|nr:MULTISPECIES: flagellar assembly peptidoglycan hydrolase FlgJ [unclassified Bradyrhizobium]MBR1219749.1 flagellar assembly peptidoglycan hydrolase FlgJ [Bradyrhizobium sp. U87765 SZCCT0131]MBR1262400.1 flagellar assembly peptidoglycan hydrolase FlgJ [Bradyrhizobium sp. U87765 SZCCT0134]MBR1308417.1 flagellar assembly peptidoglycan hydrolase FlgJ [Bradyrhizobium sp. U87765 SZCCT0110]MBR1318182.1 flagellar assembly peptidoglycan hydrolase FlgJ [Bradyrhizobium sp. U87765 SZCCT0109]MBR1351885.1